MVKQKCKENNKCSRFECPYCNCVTVQPKNCTIIYYRTNYFSQCTQALLKIGSYHSDIPSGQNAENVKQNSNNANVINSERGCSKAG